MKAADQVLAVRGVDAGLAAHRAVDLGEERGRQLNHPDAAPDDAGREAGEIADDAAAERQDDVAAVDLRVEQEVRELIEMRKILGRLAGIEDDRPVRDIAAIQGRGERAQMAVGDVAVGDDDRLRPRQQRPDQIAGACNQAAADDDVIGAFAELDAHAVRRPRSGGA